MKMKETIDKACLAALLGVERLVVVKDKAPGSWLGLEKKRRKHTTTMHINEYTMKL